MEYIPLNFALLKNPFNWVIVTLMVVIAGLGLHAAFPASPGISQQNNQDGS